VLELELQLLQIAKYLQEYLITQLQGSKIFELRLCLSLILRALALVIVGVINLYSYPSNKIMIISRNSSVRIVIVMMISCSIL